MEAKSSRQPDEDEFFDAKDSWDEPSQKVFDSTEDQRKCTATSSTGKLPLVCFKKTPPCSARDCLGSKSPITFGPVSDRILTAIEPNQTLDSEGSKMPVRSKMQATYFRVQTQKSSKESSEFRDMVLAQELRSGFRSIRVARFNRDGTYFATGGEDGMVRVWEFSELEAGKSGRFFNPKPLREYSEHSKEVLDLSWCTKNACMLLSAGLDGKIVLWNLNRPSGPMAVFVLSEPVTCVAFMPDSDEFFATGSLDMAVRLWDLEAQTVIDWQKTPHIITSLKFSPDGHKLLVGLYKGKCSVYVVEDLKLNYLSVLNCKNRYGKYSDGRKVTGIHFRNNSEALITTGDSRLRLMNLDSFSQTYKYKGHSNTKIQMNATISDDGDYVISGSEDGNVYIWNTKSHFVPLINPLYTGFNSDHNSSTEYFTPFNGMMVTNAQFAPEEVTKMVSKLSLEAEVRHVIVACSYDGLVQVYYHLMSRQVINIIKEKQEIV